MAIAANFRKHPQALALQLVLPFGHLLKWATSRPTTKLLRDIRAARGRAFAAAGRVAYPVEAAVPQWWREMKKRATALAKVIKHATMQLELGDPIIEALEQFGVQHIGKSLTSGDVSRRLIALRREKKHDAAHRLAVAATVFFNGNWLRMYPAAVGAGQM